MHIAKKNIIYVTELFFVRLIDPDVVYPFMLSCFNGSRFKIFTTLTENNSNSSVKNMFDSFAKFFIEQVTSDVIIFISNITNLSYIYLLFIDAFLNYQPDIIVRGNIFNNISFTFFGRTIVIRALFSELFLDFVYLSSSFNTLFDFCDINLDIDLNFYFQNYSNIVLNSQKKLVSFYIILVNIIGFVRRILNIDFCLYISLSSLTQAAFLLNFNKLPFVMLERVHDLFIRNASKGSVKDSFKPFGDMLVRLDFNSMYPSIMGNLEVGLLKPVYINTISNLLDFCKNKAAFLKVKILCKNKLKQPLIMIDNNFLNVQPNGKFIYTVWSKELLYCLEHYKSYYDFEFLEGFYFEEQKSIFFGYIDFLFSKRLQYKNLANKSAEILIKLFMNSLYGRFCIKIFDNINILVNKEELSFYLNNVNINVLDVSVITRHLNLVTYTWKKIDYSYLISKLKPRIDWAVIILSEARIMIQRLKSLVEIYYVNTDSIVIKAKDLFKVKNYMDKVNMGFLRISDYWDFCFFIDYDVFLLQRQTQILLHVPPVLFNFFRCMRDAVLINYFKSLLWRQHLAIFFFKNLINFKNKYKKRHRIFFNNVWIDSFPIVL